MSMGPNSFRMPQMPKFNFGVNLPTPSPQLQNALSRVPAVDPRMAFGGTAGRGVPASAIPAAALGALSFGSTVPRAAPAMPQIPAAIQAPQLQPQPDFGVFKPATAPAIPMPTMRPAAPVQPSSLFDSGAGFTTFNLSDGTTERRTGPRGIRNNNPGNLTGSAAAEERFGAIGRDYENNLVFATPELGKRAYRKFVFEQNADRKLGEFIHNTYAPPGSQYDINDTNKGYNGFLRGKGFNLDQRIGDMTPPERQALENAMFQFENGVEFGDGTAPTRNEPGRGMSSGDLGVLAEATARGAATAEARIDQGKAKPLSAAERRRFGPENLGMIAFGLSLLGGEDVTTAMNNGLNVYGMFEGMDDAKEQQDAIDAAIAQLPPEQQEYARALYETNPEGFSQLMGQQFAPGGEGGSNLGMATSQALEQGFLTEQDAQAISLLEAQDPLKAAELFVAKQEQREGEFASDSGMLNEFQKSTSQIDDFAQKALAVIAEIEGDSGKAAGYRQFLTNLQTRDNPVFTNSPGARLDGFLQTLQGLVAFNALQNMRNNSPTGGALGNVSNVELGLLAATEGKLTLQPGFENLKGVLRGMIENNRTAMEKAQSAYDKRYSRRLGGAAVPTQAAAAPATGELLHTTEDGIEVYGS